MSIVEKDIEVISEWQAGSSRLAATSSFFDSCYGDRSVGIDVHSGRITRPGTRTYLLINADGIIVAGSYVRKDGKREALAVLPELRGKGLAGMLLRATLLEIPYQFTEINFRDLRLHQLFLREGFSIVSSAESVLGRFAGYEHLIKRMEMREGHLVYVRESEHDPSKTVSYIMLVKE